MASTFLVTNDCVAAFTAFWQLFKLASRDTAASATAVHKSVAEAVLTIVALIMMPLPFGIFRGKRYEEQNKSGK
jgi:hypothetical protein